MVAQAPSTAIYLPPWRAVYVDIAKVASSSLKALFADLLGLDMPSGNPHAAPFERPPAYDPAGVRLYPGCFAFAAARDPYARLLSCYRDKIGGEAPDFTDFAESGVAHCLAGFDVFHAAMSFGEFVRAVATIPDVEADEHFRSQTFGLVNDAGEIAIDHIVRFESLDVDLARLASALGIPLPTRLPWLQAAGTPVDHRSAWSPVLRSIVAERYASDFRLLGYHH